MCVDEVTVSCAIVWTVQLIAKKSITAVKTKMELDSHVDTCVVYDQCFIIHDYNRKVKVLWHNLKIWSNCAHSQFCFGYDEPEIVKFVILLIHKAIKMEGLNYHLHCSKQCCMNDSLIDEVPKFLELVPSETMQVIQIMIPFDTIHPIISPFKLTKGTSYFNVRKPTQEEFENQNILKIELKVETPP